MTGTQTANPLQCLKELSHHMNIAVSVQELQHVRGNCGRGGSSNRWVSSNGIEHLQKQCRRGK